MKVQHFDGKVNGQAGANSLGCPATDVSGVSFMQQKGAVLSILMSGLFSVLVFALFAHDVSLGSFWCPLSQCDAMKSTNELVAFPDGTASMVAQRAVFASFCLVLDIGILVGHWTHAVHPKYQLRSSRRWNMRLHMISGTLQCLGGPLFLLFWYTDEKDAAQYVCWVTGIFGFCIHIPTALYLLTNAFGAVRIMIPGFVHATAAYAYTLSRLLICHKNRLDHEYLTYWLVFHVYVYNRVIFVFLTTANVLAGARYTLSILLGLAIALPAALGWTSIPFLIAAVAVFNGTFALSMDKKVQATVDRYSAGGTVTHAKIKRHFVGATGCFDSQGVDLPRSPRKMTAMERARFVFDILDSDKSGKVSLEELGDLLVSWGLPRTDAEPTMREYDRDGSGHLCFEEFYETLSVVWEFAAGVMLSNSEHALH
mmetsp:Transcript_50378/g.79868  ORF Transcript_50378/g.79868 Transcript_50378/m.79868 type:complete len:425 (-) Transcript_50378:114-1388(-)